MRGYPADSSGPGYRHGAAHALQPAQTTRPANLRFCWLLRRPSGHNWCRVPTTSPTTLWSLRAGKPAKMRAFCPGAETATNHCGKSPLQWLRKAIRTGVRGGLQNRSAAVKPLVCPIRTVFRHASTITSFPCCPNSGPHWHGFPCKFEVEFTRIPGAADELVAACSLNGFGRPVGHWRGAGGPRQSKTGEPVYGEDKKPQTAEFTHFRSYRQL